MHMNELWVFGYEDISSNFDFFWSQQSIQIQKPILEGLENSFGISFSHSK